MCNSLESGSSSPSSSGSSSASSPQTPPPQVWLLKSFVPGPSADSSDSSGSSTSSSGSVDLAGIVVPSSMRLSPELREAKVIHCSEIYLVVELEDGRFSYELYGFDLSDDIGLSAQSWVVGAGEVRPDPVIRLPRAQFPAGMAFFGTETRIYMIGRDGQQVHFYEPGCWLPKVASPMVRGMENPYTIGTLKDRCYVISFNLFDGNFERFDAFSEDWEVLPGPPVPSGHGAIAPIRAHAFVGDVIVMDAAVLGFLLYDTLQDRWTRLESCHIPFRGVAQYFDRKWFVLRRDLPDFPLYAFGADSKEVFGKGRKVRGLQERKELKFSRTGDVFSLGDALGAVFGGTDGVQLGLYYPSRRATVSELVVGDSSGDSLSAVCRHELRCCFRSSPAGTISACFPIQRKKLTFRQR